MSSLSQVMHAVVKDLNSSIEKTFNQVNGDNYS